MDDGEDKMTEKEGVFLNEEDIVEVIDLDEDESIQADMLADHMDDVGIGEGDIEHEDGMEGAEYSVRDDAEVVFTSHRGSVFCVHTDPETCSMAVTGGEDDRAFVWKLGSGEEVLECTGHKDSVVACAFNRNSKYVATGDMSGLLKVWELATQKEVWTFECSDLEWLCWHGSTDVLLAGTTDGNMWMWMIPSGLCKTYQGPGCSCSCGKIMPDGKQVCAGYEDGSVRVWDLKAGSPSFTVSGHESFDGGVTCIDCHKDNNMVLAGSSDVTAKLFNVNSKKVLCSFNCASAEMSSEENSVEAVGFSSTTTFAATGTLEGKMTIWDIPSQSKRFECKHEAGIVRLRWDTTLPLVFTCALDGVTQLWDARSGKREAEWSGHQGEILDFGFTRDSNLMVTCSGDSTARVFNLTAVDR
ncbi:angio-associated migratory cell protein-like isoform X2 [Lineus longissimus]|uniref:angio-associated migratory cell protein-like isoform X2 n=1 Tax=Lineus longissimus TaxID=88925 RepID=UPI00315D17CC